MGAAIQATKSGILFASAARTATTNSGELLNTIVGADLHVRINVTAASATPSVVFTIQGWDGAAGEWYTVLASSAVTGTGTTDLRVGSSQTGAGNVTAQDQVPHRWRLLATHADADSITYSAWYELT